MQRSSSMNLAAAFLAVAAIACTWLIVAPAASSSGTSPSVLGSWSIRGRLTIELKLEPSTGASNDWASPIKDVDEVILLEDWALLRKRQLGANGTLLVPREKIVYMNIVE